MLLVATAAIMALYAPSSSVAIPTVALLGAFVLERIAPDTEVINTDASRPVGYCSVQSAHIGYKAQLWKVVRENGVEVAASAEGST